MEQLNGKVAIVTGAGSGIGRGSAVAMSNAAAPTNVVFTGDKRDTIVVPNLGRWHLTRFRTSLQGVPLFYPTPEKLGITT